MKRFTTSVLAAALITTFNPTIGSADNTGGAAATDRVVIIKVVKQSGGKKTETATRVAFTPGKKAEVKLGESKSGDKTSSIELVVDSISGARPPQHLIEIKVKGHVGDKAPSLLAAPKLLTLEGQPASIQIADENGDGIKIEVLVESVK